MYGLSTLEKETSLAKFVKKDLPQKGNVINMSKQFISAKRTSSAMSAIKHLVDRLISINIQLKFMFIKAKEITNAQFAIKHINLLAF